MALLGTGNSFGWMPSPHQPPVPPARKTEAVTFYLNATEKRRLEKLAWASERNRSTQVRLALRIAFPEIFNGNGRDSPADSQSVDSQ